MALTNYGDLKTAVATRLSRSNMTALIPDFIAITHSKMMRGDVLMQVPALRIDDMLTSTTLTMTTGTASLPADYLESKRLYLDSSETPGLRFIPIEKWYSMNVEGQSGTPQFYTFEGSTLRVAPYDSNDVNLYYYAALDALSDDADTNAIFTKAPHAYLYGALAEAYEHMRQFDYAARYGQKFASAVRSLNEEAQAHEYSGDVLAATADRVT